MAEENGNYHNKEQDRRLDAVEKHIRTTNEEMGHIQVDLAQVKTDVSWLKRSYWVIATASVGALVGALINLLLHNNG